MPLSFLVKGILLGFSIAAPVGPIGVLCIRRTLSQGRLSGLVSGVGAATADAFYGSVAGFGLTYLTDLLVSQRSWIGLFGGVFLLYLGVRTFLSQPASEAAAAKTTSSLAGDYFSTLFLTLTNPMTILSFAAIFAGFGLAAQGGDYLSAGVLVLGVFLGSLAWWLLLSGIVGMFRGRFTTRWMVWVNRLSGTVLVLFGLSVLFI